MKDEDQGTSHSPDRKTSPNAAIHLGAATIPAIDLKR